MFDITLFDIFIVFVCFVCVCVCVCVCVWGRGRGRGSRPSGVIRAHVTVTLVLLSLYPHKEQYRTF